MMLDFNDAEPQKPFANVTELPSVRKARVLRAVQLRIRDLVRTLYPNATGLRGDTARIGGVSGENGASLAIALSPLDSAGLWKEFHEGTGLRDGGDVFDLYAMAHGMDRCDLPKVVEALDAWVGGSPPAYMQQRHEALAAKPPAPVEHEEIVCAFPYLSSTGEKLFETCRIEYRNEVGAKVLRENGKPKKSYRPRRIDGSWGYPPGQWSLYRLPDIDRTQEIVLVEGEPCADALNGIGITATTAPGGSSVKPEKVDWRPLAGKAVTLWPDNDAPGLKFMGEVAAHLKSIGCTVRLLTPPASKPEKWDAADGVAEGFDVVGFLKAPTAPDGPAILHRLWPDITYRYEPELVENLFPRVGVATLYGPSGGGKSFALLDWVSAIALGRSLFGLDTEAVGILYLAFEGFHGITKRIHGIKQERGLNAVALELVEAPWILTDPQDWHAMRAHIEAARQRLDETGYPMGIIVVDTLTAAFAGVDANSQAEVTMAMRQLKRLAMELGCLVIAVGHTGKNTTLGMAGSFAYKSESDSFIELQAETDPLTGEIKRSVRVEKVKDGPSGYVLSDFRLREVRIGTKPNGKPITTCVVEWVQPANSAPSRAAAEQAERERMDAVRLQVLDAMVECLRDEWLPRRETADLLKVNGGVTLGRDSLEGVLSTLAEGSSSGVSLIAHANRNIEIRTRRTTRQTIMHFRVTGDD